jgi:hypothetical protein
VEHVGQCNGLRQELALAFTMGTHDLLVVGSEGGQEAVVADSGQAPAAGQEEEGCPYMMMPADLVKQVVEACGWRKEGELGEGVVLLMGGGGRGGGEGFQWRENLLALHLGLLR